MYDKPSLNQVQNFLLPNLNIKDAIRKSPEVLLAQNEKLVRTDHLYVDPHGRDPKQALKTKTGRLVWPLDLRPEDVCLDDLIWGMAHQNRFGGHTLIPINVCWHSLNLSYLVPKKLRFAALVHDVTEAYMADIPRPLKDHPAFKFFKAAEDRLFMGIAQSLNWSITKVPEELYPFDVNIGYGEMYLYHPAGYENTLRCGFPVSKDRAARKMADGISDLIKRGVVPKPKQTAWIRKAWLQRYNELIS